MTQKNQQMAVTNEVKDVIKKAGDRFQKVKTDLEWNKEAFYSKQMIDKNSMLQSFVRQNPQSVINAIVNVATVGLTLNPALSYAYLVPRDGKCSLDISYRGFIKILTDSGTVRNIEAEDVHEGDYFVAHKGTSPKFEFSRALKNRGELLGTFALAHFHDGGCQWLYMDLEEIQAVAKTSATFGKSFSPWQGPFEGEMRKKTVIRRLFKTLPHTKIRENVITALEIDNDTNHHKFDSPKDKGDLNEIFEDAQEVTETPEKEPKKGEGQEDTTQEKSPEKSSKGPQEAPSPPSKDPKSGLFKEGS